MFVHALSGFSIVRRARGWRTSTRRVAIVVRGKQTVIARAHRPLWGCTPPSDASLRTAPNYDLVLVFASIAVSIMDSFTGLTLTRGVNALPDVRRKFMIVMASMALGGGIWSMHFVAMLAMSLPVPISYDAISTLGSALIAILMCGIAILIMHYVGRTWIHTAVAGTILGNGIVVMHYVGMSGIRGCLPTFELPGIVLAVLGATAMGIVALRISYVRRSTGHVFLGAIIFGLSVVLVHVVAVGWTGFRVGEGSGAVAPLIDNGILALLVMLSAFVICGTFLLTATNFVLVGRPRHRLPFPPPLR